MRAIGTTVLIIGLILSTTLGAQGRTPEEIDARIDELKDYLRTRWHSIPVQTASVSEPFSLEGSIHYQTETEGCWISDTLSIRIVEAHLTYRDGTKPDQNLESITVGLGERIEGGWHILSASEPYRLTSEDFFDGGIRVANQAFNLDGFVCEELVTDDFPAEKDPAWLVFVISYDDRATVYAHGTLRANSQSIF